jgi:pimeloyl-ACP methyl ester carboxylesterase
VHAPGQRHVLWTLGAIVAFTTSASGVARGEEGASHVRGGEVGSVEIDGTQVPWADLEQPRATGAVDLVWRVPAGPAGSAFEVPVCAGRGKITVDGVPAAASDAGPVVLPLSGGQHVVSAHVTISGYERRVACGEPARVGVASPGDEGLQRLAYTSSRAAGGRAAVFLPPRTSDAGARAMLVLPHPWNGSIWTYAAYAELLDEAKRRDVVLLFPSGLGNSLYTAPAEDEVMAAVAAAKAAFAIDPARVSIAGASMGGAGATTIGFHHPDAIASITSFFGDSRYDLATYVRPILKDAAGAHAVNAADVADNARLVPVWLVHGEDDRVSPIAQSEILAQALAARGISARFDRVPGIGHAGALFARFARELVKVASEARAVQHPTRVTYRAARAQDTCAYGVCLERAHAGDAFVDVERGEGGAPRVNRTENVRAFTLEAGALGLSGGRFEVEPHGDGARGTWTAASR